MNALELLQEWHALTAERKALIESADIRNVLAVCYREHIEAMRKRANCRSGSSIQNDRRSLRIRRAVTYEVGRTWYTDTNARSGQRGLRYRSTLPGTRRRHTRDQLGSALRTAQAAGRIRGMRSPRESATAEPLARIVDVGRMGGDAYVGRPGYETLRACIDRSHRVVSRHAVVSVPDASCNRRPRRIELDCRGTVSRSLR